MKILFLHGWTSKVGGVKPAYLTNQGYEVLNPSLPDDNFEESISIAEEEFHKHSPHIIVGSSRGGAVAINMNSGDIPMVLLCPAWKRWGNTNTIKQNSIILHSKEDDVIPFNESEELIHNSKMNQFSLIQIGHSHRLAENESLAEMVNAVVSLTS